MIRYIKNWMTSRKRHSAEQLLKEDNEWASNSRQSIAQGFIKENQAVAVNLLRQDQEFALSVVSKYFEQQALAAGVDPQRRTTPFPALPHMAGYPGGGTAVSRSLPKITPYNLRRFSELPPARRAINFVRYAIEGLKWNIVRYAYPGDRDVPLSDEQKIRREIAMNCLTMPNRTDTWRTLMGAVIEDMVVGGYGAIELQETGNRARPYFLFPVDGASIRINPDWDDDPNIPRYVQSYSYGGMHINTGDQDIPLLDSELIYLRMLPRTNTPFGLGYLEVAFRAINAWLGSFEFSERRASNSTPLYGIFLGEDVDTPYVSQFRRYWTDHIEGYGNVPIWGGGEKPQVMPFRGGGEDELFLKWQEMLVKIIAMAFGLTSLTMNISQDVNRSTAASMQIEEWTNLKPLISLVADYMTREFIWKVLGYKDLAFEFVVLESDERRQAEIIRMRWQTDAVTVNEIRHLYDLDPIDAEWGNLTKSRYEAKAKAENPPASPLGQVPIGGM